MRTQNTPYNENWPQLYLQEKQIIKNLLGTTCVRIFHIGSTSVPNLQAKPVIDILLVVDNLKTLDTFNASFIAHGYKVMGENGIPLRRFYKKDNASGVRTHHIHAFQFDNYTEIERHLNFRDFLRKHSDVCNEYASLKDALASKYPDDIIAYCDGKDAFVKDVEKKATLWYWVNR